jgi:DNA-binding NarL/FixJ family response regulator
LGTSSIRVLLVEDFEPFRRFLRSTLHRNWACKNILEASDGEEAIALAQEFELDLVLLDIGLPNLNGIDVARKIRELAPQRRILLISQESSADVVREALSTGASGYVAKTDAGSELVTAINAVLRGEKFVSSGVAGHDFKQPG